MPEPALQKNLLLASDYLTRNHELRSCLGIARDAVLDIEPLGSGEHNLNYMFSNPSMDARYVLRINIVPQPFHEDQIAYESDALGLLTPSGCVPRVLYSDSSRRLMDYGAMVISFCDGEELDFDDLAPGDLACAAKIMANIHSVRVDDAACSALYRPQDPLQQMYDEAKRRFDDYLRSGFEDRRITEWCNHLFEATQKVVAATPPSTGSRAIINTETLPSHFLIARKGDEARSAGFPGYMIDWERPIIGEPAQDIAYFVSPTSTFWDSDYLFPADDVDGFLGLYIDAVEGRFELGNFRERFLAYRAMTVLRSTSWCCRALARYKKASSESSVPASDSAGSSKVHRLSKTAEKLDTYLSDEFLELMMKECF